MYFIILSTATTLFPAGIHRIDSAADAARALQPLAGHLAGVLFACGIVAVGRAVLRAGADRRAVIAAALVVAYLPSTA